MKYLEEKYRECYLQSLKELVFIVALSIVPVVIGAAIKFKSNEMEYIAILKDSLLRGQFFLFSFSVLATVFWVYVGDNTKENLTRRPIWFLFNILALVVAAMFLGSDPDLAEPLDSFTAKISSGVFVGCLILYLVSLIAIKNAPSTDPGEVIADEINALEMKVKSDLQNRKKETD